MTWDTIKNYAAKAGGVVIMGAIAGAVVLVMLRNRVDPIPPQPDPSPTAPITLPAEVKANVGEMVRVDVKTLKPGMELTWEFVASESMKFDKEIFGQRAALVARAEGELWVVVATVMDGKPFLARSHVVSGKGPQPPPIPPEPKPPEPKPPTPPEPPAPIPGPGSKLLVVWETGEADKLPRSQLAVCIGAVPMRAWLKAQNIDYRIFDKDADMSAAPQVWQDAMKRTRTGLPWVIYSNGRTGFEGPLPVSWEELQAKIEGVK